MAKRTVRELVGMTDAKARTARLLRTVAHELERLGVRCNAEEDDSVAYFDWAIWMAVPANDSEYEAVKLKTDGFKGHLLVHRGFLENS
jgi:hypothetical protein